MKQPIPAELRGVLDALLLGLDPRLSQDERDACMVAAVQDAPEFVAGVLTEIVTKHLNGLERLRALPPGTLVDRMRADYLPETSRKILGYALHDAAPGEEVQFRLADEPSPNRREWLEQSATVQPVAPAPEKVWTVADAAAAAERDRIARREAELTGGGTAEGDGYPRHQTGGTPASVDLRGLNEQEARAAELLNTLRARRADEQAIDQADPDDPRTMGPAMRAALDPTQLEPDTEDVPNATPYGGNPADSYTPCSVQTGSGPCILRAGHPELPVPGTENGHMSQETLL